MRAFHAAIDLGAGSGRVFVGTAAPDAVGVRELHRFHYAPRPLDGHLRWDMPRLVEGLRIGLQHAEEAARTAGGELISVGVDGWGVDYGLLDDEGRLIEEPICYRDERTTGVMEEVFARVPRETIFTATGIQLLPFNTLFQLAAHVSAGFTRGRRTIASDSRPLSPAAVWLRRQRAHERFDDATPECTGRGLERRSVRALAAAARADAGAGARRKRHRLPAARPDGGARPATITRRRAGDARHGQCGPRHTAGKRLGLHLVRDLVAGRCGAGRASRRCPGLRGELYQRARRRRNDSVPQERDGIVASRVVPTRMGVRRRVRESRPAAGARRRALRAVRADLSRRSTLLQSAQHDA